MELLGRVIKRPKKQKPMDTQTELLEKTVQSQARLENALTAPHVLMRPRIFHDKAVGSWCVRYGDDIENGVSGWGETPRAAMADFDYAWERQKVSSEKLHKSVENQLKRQAAKVEAQPKLVVLTEHTLYCLQVLYEGAEVWENVSGWMVDEVVIRKGVKQFQKEVWRIIRQQTTQSILESKQ